MKPIEIPFLEVVPEVDATIVSILEQGMTRHAMNYVRTLSPNVMAIALTDVLPFLGKEPPNQGWGCYLCGQMRTMQGQMRQQILRELLSKRQKETLSQFDPSDPLTRLTLTSFGWSHLFPVALQYEEGKIVAAYEKVARDELLRMARASSAPLVKNVVRYLDDVLKYQPRPAPSNDPCSVDTASRSTSQLSSSRHIS